jgi:hypothetical protein
MIGIERQARIDGRSRRGATATGKREMTGS